MDLKSVIQIPKIGFYISHDTKASMDHYIWPFGCRTKSQLSKWSSSYQTSKSPVTEGPVTECLLYQTS